MPDSEHKIEHLRQLAKDFRDARDWKQFHDVKNLAEAIAIESGELQELFLWKDKEDIHKKLEEDTEFRNKVIEEFADILIFCLHFSNSSGIEISEAVIKKFDITDGKYPVEKAKGNATKYTEL